MKRDKPSARPKKTAGEKKKSESDSVPDVFKPVRDAVQAVSPKNGTMRWIGLALFCLVVMQAFLFLLDLQASALMKFAGSALLFALTGEMMRGWMGWDGFFGLILFKDRSTLAWIDRQAQRYAPVWNVLADLGLVLGYGLSSYFLFGPEQRKPAKLLVLYLIGIPLLLIFASIIAPAALAVMTGLVAHNDFHAASDYLHQSAGANGSGSSNLLAIALGVTLVLGGLAATTLFSLTAYAVIITPPVLIKIVSVLFSLVTGKSDGNHYVPPPGGQPLLPGINLPFVEGILALAVLLVVHEMSHGLLARVRKIRLDSAGIVFFGLLPFGAFVEPDEKELDAQPAWAANRVLGAGSTANLLTAIFAFTLLVGFMLATAPYRLEGYRVVDGPVPAGTMMYAVNGVPYMAQNLSLAPNQPVTLTTSRGTMTPTTDAQGRIGIHLEYVSKSGAGFRFQYAPAWEWMAFVANCLGLIFALNVLVGIVNLLPIPLFDGHRLMVNGVNNKLVSDAISILAAAAFVLNFLPWLFK